MDSRGKGRESAIFPQYNPRIILHNRFDRTLDMDRLNENVWGFPRVREFYETNDDSLMWGVFTDMNGLKRW